jgi:hypothetical protein
VSENLNKWIDLIFGYKQRGENAVKFDNLFHNLSYEINWNHVKENERHGLEIQIQEFGQTPIQVLKIDNQDFQITTSRKEDNKAKHSR